jgi:hypothetical protein
VIPHERRTGLAVIDEIRQGVPVASLINEKKPNYVVDALRELITSSALRLSNGSPGSRCKQQGLARRGTARSRKGGLARRPNHPLRELGATGQNMPVAFGWVAPDKLSTQE